jgi:predicted exporter
MVAEGDDDDRPKKKQKKKKSGGISKADWKREEEERMYAAYKFKRLLYMAGGAGTIVICAAALGIFWANGMLGLLPVGVCVAGFLGGLYCMWQGFSGSFHHD